MHIVGSNKINLNHFNISEDAKTKILFHPFSTNLKAVFERSRVLIDVDADIEEDVFISSKLKDYLSVNRMIVSITGKNSPSRKFYLELLKCGLFLTLQIQHFKGNLEWQLIQSICKSFDDRKSVLDF